MLRDWLVRHPEARRLYFDCVGDQFLRRSGIEIQASLAGPGPRWVALSADRLRDYTRKYRDFESMKPFYQVGYSIYIYVIDGSGTAAGGRRIGQATGPGPFRVRDNPGDQRRVQMPDGRPALSGQAVADNGPAHPKGRFAPASGAAIESGWKKKDTVYEDTLGDQSGSQELRASSATLIVRTDGSLL